MREAEQLERIIAEEAERRMLAGKATDPPATLPEGRSERETRTQVAEAVGMKPRTFAKVQHVFNAAEGKAEASEPVREVAQQQMAALDAGRGAARLGLHNPA